MTEHTYLRYECADAFGSVVSTGSSRAPNSNALLQFTAGTTRAVPSLLWSVTGSSITAHHAKTCLPIYRFAHRDPDSIRMGTGRALNSSECVCLDTRVEQDAEEGDNESEAESSTTTAIRIATGWVDGAVRVFELTTGEWRSQKPLGLVNTLIQGGDIDDEAGGRDESDFSQREPLVLNGHGSSPVRVVRFEPRSRRRREDSHHDVQVQGRTTRLASGGSDGSVVVWDVVEEIGLFRLVGHNRGGARGGSGGGGSGGGGITDLAFVSVGAAAMDGLVSSCADGLVKVWDLRLQCCVQTIVNHPGPVLGMDCHNVGVPPSRHSHSEEATESHRWRLVTGSVDGLVRVWAVQAPQKGRRETMAAPESEDPMEAALIAVPGGQDKALDDNPDDADACCRFLGTVSPPPNAATAHHHQKIASVRWHYHRYLGVLRADSKFVDVYQVHTEREAAKRRQRRLRRRREKLHKKKTRDGAETEPTKKRGILDDPESDSSDEELDGRDRGSTMVRDAHIDPERVKASDELEYLTTVVASHKVRSFVFAPAAAAPPSPGVGSNAKSSSSRSLVQVVCALGTNAIESYNVVRTKDPKQKHLPHGVVTAEKVPVLELASHPTGIRAVALSGDDSLACTVSKNVTQVWNVRTRRCIHTMTASDLIRGGTMAGIANASSTVYGLCALFLPGNSHVVVGTREGHLLLLDIRAGAAVFTQEKAHDGAIWSIDLTRTGSSVDDASFSIVTGSADHTVKFWVLESESGSEDDDEEENQKGADRPVLVHVRTLELKDDVVAVRYSHSADAAKRLVFVATLDNTIKVFFDDSLKLFLNLYGHSLPALAVDSSDDDTILASGGADKTVKIWGLDFGDTHRTMHGHEDSITDLRFVRRTHNFFTSSKDFTVRYWDGDRFEQILVLQGHSAEVNCLAVSRSGAYVLSGGRDRQVRVWERTKDIVFLEEERERALEQVFDRVGGRDASGTASILESKDDESDDGHAHDDDDQPQSESAVQRSVLSVAAGDRLLEGLERADQELKDIMAWKKANGPDKPKQPNPLLLGLEPAHFVLWLLKTIKSAELEQSLLVLPLTHIERLVYYCSVLLRQGRGVELCSKVSVFLVKTHQNQIATHTSMATPLRELRRLVRLRLSESRDVVGYNLAALQLVARIVQERKESLQTMDDIRPQADVWAGLGLGSDVASALERKSGSSKRRR